MQIFNQVAFNNLKYIQIKLKKYDFYSELLII